MEKEIGQIRFVETDDGLRVEVSGEKIKETVARCGLSALSCCVAKPSHGSENLRDCCTPDEKSRRE